MKQRFTSYGILRASALGVALALNAWAGTAVAAGNEAATVSPAQGVTGMTRTATGIALHIQQGTQQGTLAIEPWSDRIVHVRLHRDAGWKGAFNPAVIGKPHAVAWQVAETPEAWTLSTPALRVRIDKAKASLSFADAAGKTILEEAGTQLRALPASGSGAVMQAFSLGDDEFTYGLGQHQNGVLDYRGNSVLLQQANRDVGVPMLVSSRGYGVLWNNASVTHVDVGLPQTAYQQVFRSEAGGGIDYHFIYGPELDDVVGGADDGALDLGLVAIEGTLPDAAGIAVCRGAAPRHAGAVRCSRAGLAILGQGRLGQP